MNPATALARVLADELIRCGVTEAVVAPGSRSAPLALALHADPRIRLHVRIDERSAGFLALGLGKVAGRPAALVCTSGTAAANFHPAVAEAAHAHVPLVVLTADRPPELRGTGANQVIDQLGLYGSAVRFFADVGTPVAAPGMVGYWRSVAARAVQAAVNQAGPVHLNIGFREPLVPDGDPDWPEPLDGRSGGRPWTVIDPAQRVPGRLPELYPELPERGAVVVADGATGADADAAVRLAEAAGWPVLSEPTGNARRGPNAVSAYPLLLADEPFAARCRAELVITVGKPGLSRSLLGWIRRSDRHIVVDPHPDWADPTRSADQVVGAVPVLGVGHRWEASSRPVTNWLGVWRRAEAAATAAIDSLLDGTDRLTEPGLARELGRLAPADSLLFVGSSKPIRDFDAQLRPDLLAHVIANRGASGIDGCVSSAVGAALAWQAAGGGPAYAVLGDLAYLHDRNGLVLGPDETRPDLCVIVVDNDGGGIFSLLPQAGIEGFERVFGTPHRADLAADAAVTGIPVAEVSTTAELAGAVKPTSGLRLVRIRTDRVAETELQHRLHAAVADALAKLDH
ncbi:MAG TPA: 2-succinyl-5-enolpyruvyl-6-hydroxy-3-cyclohexene-1-carboxylic-acid synthase [Actinomycetes bacterium]|nr:2-succinyl-5-enolpyruvyl-6-hydroxy-3-cyclohexene-1-carboxylic-acid synthase [Actinomycetes bacterium]